jgi:RNA polymerase sigma-70 factor (ECF subfamily)
MLGTAGPPEEPSLPFREVIRRALAGDRRALDEVLARLQPILLEEAERSLGERLRGKTRASDVLQDAYFEVVRHLADFAGETEESFIFWVTAIIRNAAARQHRRLEAKKRRAPTHTSGLEALAQAILKETHSPASELERQEATLRMMTALASLREDYRLVLDQVELTRRPIADVAHDLGVSKAAISMRLTRARAALRRALEQGGEAGA